MSFNSRVFITFLAAASSTAAPYAAMAQGAARLEAFGGVARDTRPLTGAEDGSSFGVASSWVLRPGGMLLQFDAIAADHLDDTVAGLAAHLMFAPSERLGLGLYSSYSHTQFGGGLDLYRVGGEAAYYSGPFTITGVAGYEEAEDAAVSMGTIPGFTVVDQYGRDGFFSMVDVTVYPSDDWSVSAGHRYVGGRSAAAFGVERQVRFGATNASFFAEGRAGNDDYTAAWVGFRLRFGGTSGGSLAARDRAYGLANRLKDDLSHGRIRSLAAIPVVAPPVIVPPVVVPPVVVPPVVVPPPPPPVQNCGNCGPCYPVA